MSGFVSDLDDHTGCNIIQSELAGQSIMARTNALNVRLVESEFSKYEGMSKC